MQCRYAHSFAPPTPSTYQRWGAHRVLENDDQILAALVLVAEPVSFLLENIAIAEDIQGTGVGGRMLSSAES